MTNSLSADTLAGLVTSQLPIEPGTLRITPIRSGKHNHSYWVESPEGRWVLRVAPPDDTGLLFYERSMMRQEPELHALIRERTTIPVAEVVAFDFSRILIDRDFLLLSALPGVPLGNLPGLTLPRRASVLQQVGGYLRDLHQLTAPECLNTQSYGYLGAHRPMAPQPSWVAAFRVMWNKLLDDVVAAGCYAEADAQALRDLFELHQAYFDRPVAASLLHMDMWSQNILVDEQGNVGGLVDFDRALWGDVELEYAILDYCGISEPEFWEGYGVRRDESEAALIRRQFYLLYEVQKYMPIRVWRGRNHRAALEHKEHSLALAAQLGLRL